MIGIGVSSVVTEDAMIRSETVKNQLETHDQAVDKEDEIASKRIRTDDSVSLNTPILQTNDDAIFCPPNLDSLEEPIKPEFYIENGMRYVKPYFFRYSSFTKSRWLKRELTEVLHTELAPRAPYSYKMAMKLGRITVNGKIPPVNYKLKGNEKIHHVVHRHESPVLEQDIKIIHEDENVLVVDKPCSIPIHPCGRYRHNSLVFLLEWLHGYKMLKILYRLDRLTSGLIILGKSMGFTQKFLKHMRNRNVCKEYLCKVDGEFPNEPTTCSEPLGILNNKMGINFVDLKNGKEAITHFERVSTDGCTSIVRCIPKTGRTHQIRVHLQYLGFPIVKDNIYNSSVWGPLGGKGGEYGKTNEQLTLDLWKDHSAKYMYLEEESIEAYEELERSVADSTVDSVVGNTNVTQLHDPYCSDCKLKFKQVITDDLFMYLHCYKYEIPELNLKFATEIPEWAKSDEASDSAKLDT